MAAIRAGTIGAVHWIAHRPDPTASLPPALAGTGSRQMKLETIDALVEDMLDEVEDRCGVDDAWLLYCQGRDAVWARWGETSGIARVVLARLHAAIQHRAAARRALAA
jgi:hypothetical protein